MARHEVTTKKVGKRYRWICTCGQRGDLVRKDRAEAGAAYHGYGNRAMTADEFLTMGDGMNASATREHAVHRAAEMNERMGWG